MTDEQVNHVLKTMKEYSDAQAKMGNEYSVIELSLITTAKELCDIPNEDGFRFIGIGENLNFISCVVKKDSNGLHRAYNEDNDELCFTELDGWNTYQNKERFQENLKKVLAINS